METIFGVLALCLGGVVSAGAAINTWRAFRAQSWPTTAGKIIVSRTRETRRKSGIVLVADIEYTYSVSGDNFRGTTVRFLQPECASEMAVSATCKYPLGREVEIRYMSEHPAVSCLEVGLHAVSWIAIPVGVFVMALGAYLIQK